MFEIQPIVIILSFFVLLLLIALTIIGILVNEVFITRKKPNNFSGKLWITLTVFSLLALTCYSLISTYSFH